MTDLYKFPRTRHLEGSRYQIGDDLTDIPFSDVKGKYMVVEEKVDGSNSGVSFSGDGKLLLQSRGHYLSGGPREKHFGLFKSWANTNLALLRDVLSDRYIMYGEWMYAKHTVYYNNLPDYFIEFDIFDKKEEIFLSTERRQSMLKNCPFVHSAHIIHEGVVNDYNWLIGLVSQSEFIKGDHLKELTENSSDKERILKETDNTNLMEGLYMKIEENGVVKERFKFVRSSFLSKVQDSESHWLNRSVIKNIVAEGL